jgi:hypothetical protein
MPKLPINASREIFRMQRIEYKIRSCILCGSRHNISHVTIRGTDGGVNRMVAICMDCSSWATVADIADMVNVCNNQYRHYTDYELAQEIHLGW